MKKWMNSLIAAYLRKKSVGGSFPHPYIFPLSSWVLRLVPLFHPWKQMPPRESAPGYWWGSDVGQSPDSHPAGEEEQRDPAGGQLWSMNHPENGRQLFLSQTPPDLPPHLESSVLVSRALPLRGGQRGAESPGKSQQHRRHSCHLAGRRHALGGGQSRQF